MTFDDEVNFKCRGLWLAHDTKSMIRKISLRFHSREASSSLRKVVNEEKRIAVIHTDNLRETIFFRLMCKEVENHNNRQLNTI